ncbi:hypothetical protein Poli38472_011192 [Pythium oligandrum]|uniref:Uncharacterized protein n=1 Tax=Pythium oligandrum TaxID=41045 RepID=A0A8K1CRV0_PYTOL|nr:hypothetical protein Poli38472_011192 [Pythium oligandrum]|eukprot:TMW67572.1 hypothetical protein Poli38472_011192 [Pythium oligandrum]
MDDEILSEGEQIYEEEHEGEEEEEEEEDDDDDDRKKFNIRCGPWAFLDGDFYRWFNHVQFAYAPCEASQSLRFGHFRYYLPWVLEDSDKRRKELREDRESLELISLMLRADPSSWLYILNERKPCFTGFDPLAFDQWEMIPRIEIRMHQRYGSEDDEEGAVKQCRHFLLESDHTTEGVQLRTRDPQADYPFVLEHVEIILRTEFLDDTLDLLKELLSLGVPVTLNSDGTAWAIGPDERIRIMTLFASNHGASCPVAPAAHSFRLSGYVSDHFIALMSAVATSDRLHDLTIDEIFGSGDTLEIQLACARWLAYACCSRASRNSLRALTLGTLRLNEACMEAVMEVIDAEDPALLLRDVPDPPEYPNQFAKVEDQAALQCPLGDETWFSAGDLHISPASMYRVIGRDISKALLQIIVPGLGPCLIKQSGVQVTRLDVSNTSPSQISSLDISSANDDQCAPELIMAIGESLQVLQFSSIQRDRVNNGVITNILASCPNLRTLRIDRANWTTVDPLLRYYGRPSELCRLTSLCLWGVVLPSFEVERLMEALANSESLIAHKLQELVLAVVFPTAESPGLDEKCARKCVSMLQSNRKLEYVQIKVQSDTLQALKTEFASLNGYLTSRRLEKLPIRQKCAFFSVIQHPDNRSRAVGQLDSRCMSRIFGFFGFFRPRRVFIELW